MFFFLSKFLPLFVYPLGLACLLLLAGLLLRRRARWPGVAMGLALLCLFLGGNRWVAYGLTRGLEWQYLPAGEPPPVDVIVVLGGGTHPAEPPRPMVEVNEAGDRLLYAAELYRRGVAPRLLLTSGLLPYSQADAPDAENMRALLELLGVPREAMWLETKSINTYENAVFSAAILAEEGVTGPVVLVTSAMHMPRAVALFERQGVEVIPAPADFIVTEPAWRRLWSAPPAAYLLGLMPEVSNLYLTSLALKEYLGIVVYALRGWV